MSRSSPSPLTLPQWKSYSKVSAEFELRGLRHEHYGLYAWDDGDVFFHSLVCPSIHRGGRTATDHRPERILPRSAIIGRWESYVRRSIVGPEGYAPGSMVGFCQTCIIREVKRR